jgi:uncharacterized membrane protein
MKKIEKTNNKKSKNLFIWAKITGLLALITMPVAPLIAPLFCEKTFTGDGCSLSSIGMGLYFVFAAMIFAIISVILFVQAFSEKKK